MRKLIFAIITMLLLQACSGLVPADTPVPSSTTTNTPTLTPTPTRTTTPTPRDTVTPIGAVPTFTPFVLVTSEAPFLDATSIPFVPIGGFESVSLTQSKIFYGSCKPNYTSMTIQVDDPIAVHIVYLFFRIESGKKPGDTTRWYGTVTDRAGEGVFRYTLRANNIPERKNFSRAWVNYQFVSADEDKNIIGRSQIFTRTLALAPCN
jgi:hypothetical protein